MCTVAAAAATADDKELDFGQIGTRNEIGGHTRIRVTVDAVHNLRRGPRKVRPHGSIAARGQVGRPGALRRSRHHSRDQRHASRHRQPISDHRQPSSISASCLLSHAFRLLFGFCFDWSDGSDRSLSAFQLFSFQLLSFSLQPSAFQLFSFSAFSISAFLFSFPTPVKYSVRLRVWG
jgi:hypothetical protein